MVNTKNDGGGWHTVDRSAKRRGRPKEIVEAEYAARLEEEKKQQQSTYYKGGSSTSSSRPSTSSSSSSQPKPNSNTVYTNKDLFKKLIEDEPDDFHLARVPRETSLKIQQARQGKNMSQKDLALAINEKISVVVDYEKGSAIPNNLILMKMERALGTKLIKK